jgi:RPA family protein
MSDWTAKKWCSDELDAFVRLEGKHFIPYINIDEHEDSDGCRVLRNDLRLEYISALRGNGDDRFNADTFSEAVKRIEDFRLKHGFEDREYA